MHPEQIEMTSNGSANEAPRGTRAKELNNAETGGRNDIMTIILANGASYDIKERGVLRRLSLEMRVEVGKRQQGREPLRFISLFFFQPVVRRPPFLIAAL